MSVVYKIIREDGLEYIGVAKDINKRIRSHRKSDRFSIHGIRSYEILYQGSHSDCESLEGFFIEKYDTFNNGLNETVDGKGKSECDNFTTLGKLYSEESKKKMSDNQWLKNGGIPWNRGKSYSLTKYDKELRSFNSTRENGRGKLTQYQIDCLLKEYDSFTISFDYALSVCKKSQYQLLLDGLIGIDQVIMKSGHNLSKHRAFSNIKSKELNVTGTWIYAIIKKYKI